MATSLSRTRTQINRTDSFIYLVEDGCFPMLPRDIIETIWMYLTVVDKRLLVFASKPKRRWCYASAFRHGKRTEYSLGWRNACCRLGTCWESTRFILWSGFVLDLESERYYSDHQRLFKIYTLLKFKLSTPSSIKKHDLHSSKTIDKLRQIVVEQL